MERFEDKNWLDEALTEAIGSEEYKANFEKWKQEHPEAVEMLTSRADGGPSAPTRPFNIGRIIMKSPITKLAAAAVIIIAVIIGIKSFSGAPAWADVVKAFNKADNIHFTKIVTLSDGKLFEKNEVWLKNQRLFREESRRNERIFDTIVDDGRNELILDEEDKTAQLRDSSAAYLHRTVEMLEVFREQKLDDTFKDITLLPDESTETALVYQIIRCGTGAGDWKGKAWVDAKSSLPLRIIAEDSVDAMDAYLMGISSEPCHRRGEGKIHTLKVEFNFDYGPIPDEVFSTAIPEGYKELPRVVYPEIMFGRVIDGQGNPVVNAGVYTSFKGECRTNENGNFAVKKPPSSPGSLHWQEFPIFVRAFKKDDPYSVAWTIIRNPYAVDLEIARWRGGGKGADAWGGISSTIRSDEEWADLRQSMLEYPLVEQTFRFDDDGGVKLVVDDGDELGEGIPGDAGELIGGKYFDKDPNKDWGVDFDGARPACPRTARDILLVMTPGSVISGRITNASGQPIGNAIVYLKEMEIRLGKNEVFLGSLGSKSKKQSHAFALTDYDGRYSLTNLPASWDKVKLEVKADGCETGELKIKGPGGGDIPEEPQIIEGCHIQLVRK